MPYVPHYTDEQLLEELRRVAAIVHGVLTKTAYDEHAGGATSATVRRRFGSWRAGLVAAGLEDRSAHRTVTTRPDRLRGPRLPDELLIAELHKVAERVGSTTITVAQVRRHSGAVGVQVMVSRYGTFGAAVAAAGLQQSSKVNRWTDRQLANNFRRVARHLGRTPIRADMGRPPSTITDGTYVYRFGSWASAVGALGSGSVGGTVTGGTLHR